jgi:TRAP-type C4-dicarboxylate transport system permease small subunit
MKKGHISVDFITEKFSPRIQAVFNSVTFFMSVAVFSAIAWYTIVYAETVRAGRNLSLELEIPVTSYHKISLDMTAPNAEDITEGKGIKGVLMMQ